jgi:hypothetical protein
VEGSKPRLFAGALPLFELLSAPQTKSKAFREENLEYGAASFDLLSRP